MRGTVYIYSNPEAERVKVGVSCGLGDRLLDLNDLWTGRKVTCQVCGGLYGNIGRPIRPHKVNGRECHGGRALPMELDVALAEKTLGELEARRSELVGRRKGSLSRRINTLAKRIERFRDYSWPAGYWHSHTEFVTERFEAVEKRAHQMLVEYLDEAAPMGEIFSCPPETAVQAVEAALDELGLIGAAAKKEMPEPPKPSGSAWDVNRRHRNLERPQ